MIKIWFFKQEDNDNNSLASHIVLHGTFFFDPKWLLLSKLFSQIGFNCYPIYTIL
jgi:hypothetical protein